MTELTDEAVKALLAHYDLPTDCDCDGDDCVKCSHYPTFQERASKQLKDAAPDLARALLATRAELAASRAREEGLVGKLRDLEDATDMAINRAEVLCDKAWNGNARDFKRSMVGVFAEYQAARCAALAPTPPDTTWHERRTMLPDARKEEG